MLPQMGPTVCSKFVFTRALSSLDQLAKSLKKNIEKRFITSNCSILEILHLLNFTKTLFNEEIKISTSHVIQLSEILEKCQSKLLEDLSDTNSGQSWLFEVLTTWILLIVKLYRQIGLQSSTQHICPSLNRVLHL